MLEILLVIMSVVAAVAVTMWWVREEMAKAEIARLKLENHRKDLVIAKMEKRLCDALRVEEGLK